MRFIYPIVACTTFLICFLGNASQVFSQSSLHQYQYVQTIGTYEEISGGTILGDIDIDEEVFNNNTAGESGPITNIGFPIGFNFVYNNQSYDRFAVGTNGYIKLGNGTFTITNSVSTAFTQTFGDTNGLKQIIAALHGDLEGQSGSTLQYRTIGTAPNRQLVVQWRKFMFWNTIGADSLNFQIRLKEGTNAIEFCYGNIVRNSTDKLVSVGMNGNTMSEAIMRRARLDSSETWQSSSASYSPNAKCDLRTAFKPLNGLKMLFYGLPPIENDLAVLGIRFRAELDFGCPGTATEPISLVIENRGTNPQTAALYGIIVNSSAPSLNALDFTPALQPAERRTVLVNQTINLTNPGAYHILAFTSLPNDTGSYRGNDTARVSTHLFSPVQLPSAPIRSLADFPARGWKFYQGRISPRKPGTKFVANNYFYSASAAVNVSAFAASTDTIQEWLVSPTYTPANGQILKFRAAITQFDTTSAVNSIDDDELQIRISTDCGTSWQTIYTVNQAVVASGGLNNVKRGFSVPINSPNPFQVAIFFTNKATNPTTTYYLHLDDITVSLGNAYDLAARLVLPQGIGATGCSQSTFDVKVQIKNTGDSIISATPARLRVNGNAPINQNFSLTPPLMPGDSTLVTFTGVSLPPNNAYRLTATVLHPQEDGFSSNNDTASTSFVYLGAANPLSLPASIDFNTLPSGQVPANWFCEQGSFLDFKVRVRGLLSSRSLSTNLNYSNQSSYAVMPLTGTLPSNYGLTYSIRMNNDNGATFTMGSNDSVTVSVSDNCGASFTRIQRIDFQSPVGFGAYAPTLVSLDAYSGKNISIRFDAYMNRTDFTGAWVDIDNIGISPVGAAAHLEMAHAFQMNPNPAKDKINVSFSKETPLQFVHIYDLNGKCLQSESWTDGATDRMIDIKNLSAGMYLLQAGNAEGFVTKKLVKQ